MGPTSFSLLSSGRLCATDGVAHPFFNYDPNKEGSGVTGKGMVAVAVPGTGHGAHRALKKRLSQTGGLRTNRRETGPTFYEKGEINRAAENWPRQHL